MARARAEYEITAEDRTGAAIRTAKKGFGGLASAASRLGGVASGVSLGGLAAMTKAAIDSGDRIQKIAIQSGFTTETISQMGHVLELQGGNMESMAAGGKAMNAFLLEANRGSKAATETLDMLGISLEELNAMSQDQRLDVFLGALHQIPDAAVRGGLAQKVFARASADMLRVADAGTDGIKKMREEADRLGLTLTREQADSMAAANDGITRLQASMRGFANTLAAEFAPGIADGAAVLTDVLLPTLRNVAGGFRAVGTLIGGLAAAGGALLEGEFGEAAEIVGMAFGDLFERIESGIDDLVGDAKGAAGTLTARTAGALAGAGAGGGGEVTLAAPQLDEQTRILREIAQKTGPARAG